MFGAQIITWLSGFVLLYFLPRYLGVEDFGRLYLALSIQMILGLMIDFGGNYLIPKEVARSEKVGRGILNSYLILRLLLWVLSIGVVILFSRLFGYSEHVYLLILILAISKLWDGGATALTSYFQGVERMEYPSIAKIVERVFVGFFAVAALFLGGDSVAIAIIFTAGALIHLLVVLWFSRNFVKISWNFDRQTFSLLRTGMPYFLFSVFSVIYYRIDAVMISAMTTETVTGWYGGAFRFFDIVMVLPMIYTAAIFPIFSRLWDDKKGTLERSVGESLRLMILFGIPVSVIIYLFSSPIVHFFMGLDEYGPSVVILQIFALSVPIVYVDFILGSAILGAADKQRWWALAGLLAIFINITVNFFLIPYTQAVFGNGGIGAAIATLATELFVMGFAIALLPKSYFASFRLLHLYKPIISSLLMLASGMFLISIGLHWMLAVVLCGSIYIIGLFLLRTFNDEEIDLIKSIASLHQFKEFSANKNVSS
jgi:O-antigen/teichoic acid export membrane protein